jgi:hypothetical protein
MTAAAAAPLRGLITQPARTLTVAAVFPAATYLADPATGRVVLSVVTADGVAQPNAVGLRAVRGDRPFAGIRNHDTIEVGDHRVCLPSGSVRITRWWSPRPTLGRVAPHGLAATVGRLQADVAIRTEPLPDDLSARFCDLTDAVATGCGQAAVRAVDRLLGLGAGLTPTGDDLVAGCLAATSTLSPVLVPRPGLRAASADALLAIADRIGVRADVATTAISAALLRHATLGEVCAPAAQFLRVLAGSRSSTRTGPDDALTGLLRVGGTSGRDLAIGLLAGARLVATAAAADHPPSTPPRTVSSRSS